MIVNKDKTWTWVKYRNDLCNSCYGLCCTMPVEIKSQDLVRLGLATEDELQNSKKKLFRRLLKAGFISSYREATGLYTLQARLNGDCFFLNNETRLCEVYEKRPEVCRKFPEIGLRPGFCPFKKKSL